MQKCRLEKRNSKAKYVSRMQAQSNLNFVQKNYQESFLSTLIIVIVKNHVSLKCSGFIKTK